MGGFFDQVTGLFAGACFDVACEDLAGDCFAAVIAVGTAVCCGVGFTCIVVEVITGVAFIESACRVDAS